MKEPYPALNRTIRQKRRQHPYKVSYNKRCLKSECQYPSFFDGQTYYSLCLKHLETEQLGPFFGGRKYDPVEQHKSNKGRSSATNNTATNNTTKTKGTKI